MKTPRVPHRWQVTPAEAIAIQQTLARRVQPVRPARPLRLVVGVDCAFVEAESRCVAAAVVWDRLSRAVIEQQWAFHPLRFAYVPGLLSFREAPAILAALRRLTSEPDALMCDGQGLAHPRRFGLACHLGVILDLPSLGCAKSVLVGQYEEPALERGARTALIHRGERVGTALRTRTGVRPVWISVGHRLDLATAEELVLDCATGCRLPEPTRRADQVVARVKAGETPSRHPGGRPGMIAAEGSSGF